MGCGSSVSCRFFRWTRAFLIRAKDPDEPYRLCNGTYSNFGEVAINYSCENLSDPNHGASFSYDNIIIDEGNILYPTPYLPKYPAGDPRRPIYFYAETLPGSLEVNNQTGGITGNAPRVVSDKTYTSVITGIYEGGHRHAQTINIKVLND